MSDLKRAEYLDNQDYLKSFRTYFQHTPNEIYLDGNSIGKLPLQVKEDIKQAVESQWGQNLIRSWNDHWLDLTTRLENKLAQLLGADLKEIKVGESTSVNLYKLIHALLSSKITPKNLIIKNIILL